MLVVVSWVEVPALRVLKGPEEEGHRVRLVIVTDCGDDLVVLLAASRLERVVPQGAGPLPSLASSGSAVSAAVENQEAQASPHDVLRLAASACLRSHSARWCPGRKRTL